MSVCRICLLELPNISYYSVDHILEDKNGTNEGSNMLKLRIMIEKCLPEMDMEICDSPVICESCYNLLKNAYKFRFISVQTEEKVYQYIEKNNLRLGESIDLNNLTEKHPTKHEDLITIEETHIKEESDESKKFDDMPVLYPEVEARNLLNHQAMMNQPQLIIKLCQISNTIVENMNSVNRNVSRNKSDCTSDTCLEEIGNCRVDGYEEKSKYEKRCLICDKCSYKASKAWLLKHKCTAYKCDECSYTTRKLYRLKRHKFTHGGEKPFACGICQKGFTEKGNLKLHMMRVHQPKPKRDKPLSFKCQEEGCNYVGSRRSDLSVHMVNHLQKYPNFCKVCNKFCTSKTDLRKHEKNCSGKNEKKEI